MALQPAHLLVWIDALQRVYAENRQWLTDLDAAIGDADHGANLDRGFTAARDELAAAAPADIKSILTTVATALIRKVGGASGPLYGTFFLRAAATCAGKTELDPAAVVALFEAGIKGVQDRGKAVPGDKTMLDTLLPALDAMRAALAAGAPLSEILQQGAAAAEAGAKATIPMEARKGRASYLGPRSIGHQDPGATSSWLLLSTAASVWS